MKNLVASARTTWNALGAGSRAALAATAVAGIALAVVAARWTSQPDFELLYSGLDAREAGAVQSALASAEIRFRASQPPGPFVIHVDGEQYYAAQNAVALAGALERAPEGIGGAAGGAAQVFQSAQERAQSALKREWQELEKQLEELSFVERARVSTSIPDKSPLRKPEPLTVAVTLTLRGKSELTQAQATSVARLARFRFNVPSQNVLVTDQDGRSLLEEGAATGDAAVAQELFDHGRRSDAELERKANEALRRVFGPDLAHVVVTSTWKQEEVETVKETIDPKNKAVVSETSSKTSSPTAIGAGIAGTEPGLEGTSADAAIANATTSDSTKSTVVGRGSELRKSRAPHLERLSLSLFLDESLKSNLAGVESAVKGAVGFDAARGDTFSAMTAPFAGIARDGEGKLVPAAETAVEAPSRLTELLLRRGVEIAVAAGLLFLLVKALRGGPRTAPDAAKKPDDVDEDRWIEMLARSRVEDLAKTDPEKLGAILSRWASDDEAPREKRALQGASR